MAMQNINKYHLIQFVPDHSLHSTLGKTSFIIIKRDKTLMKWFRKFRDNQTFSILNPINSESLPLLLDANPDLVAFIIHFCKSNLINLTVKALHYYVMDKALPDLVDIIRKERNDDKYSLDHLLKENRLKSLCCNTMHTWMKNLGFQYLPRKKLTMLVHMRVLKM